MSLSIVRNDISKMRVDAIVNTANTELKMSCGGVCGAIFSAAGARELQAECDKLAPIAEGEAVITNGYALPAKFVIHISGPVFRDGRSGEERQLRSCYLNALRLAVENKCESIAFPLISSGLFGYPKGDALRVATSAIRDFLQQNDIAVYIVVWDKRAFEVSTELFGDVESYIDAHYVENRRMRREYLLDVEIRALKEARTASSISPSRLKDVVGNLDEPFSAALLRLIRSKDRTEVDVYKRANVDRKLFSKIRSNPDYAPSKRTVLAFAVALELTLDETGDLLERSGFALSHSRKFDVIVEYFITHGKYNIFDINEVLFSYDQPLLGA